MNPEFEELADRLSKEVAKQLGAAERRLTARVDHTEKELKRHSKMHMESLKEHVKLAAEGYGATLEGIDRSLQDLAVKWDTKIADHDLVLSDHVKRIQNLEQLR